MCNHCERDCNTLVEDNPQISGTEIKFNCNNCKEKFDDNSIGLKNTLRVSNLKHWMRPKQQKKKNIRTKLQCV